MLIFFQELCLQLSLWLLKLIDGLMEIFFAIAGVTNVNYHGQSVNIIELLAGDSTVMTIFWCIFILAVGLTCIFTIVGLVKNRISGLQWSAVDFHYKTITIRRTIVGCFVDGKYTCVEKERTKTKKSLRTLPLMPVIEEMLLRMKAKQEEEREFFRNSYKNTNYIYVHENGEYYNPNYITCAFVKHLKNCRFRHIRFHDLRHSCATLMRHEGIKMEDIQKWLGHSQLATTEKIYAHFEEEQHIASAEIIARTLSFADE